MSASPRRLARALAFAAMAACALAAAAERRVALLIGNNTYNATPLQNAVNDARDLGAALRALGFTTIVRENTTRRDMIEALREFGQAIERADAAVFFYAGHALQFKDRNYLLPIDSDVRSEEDIGFYAVEIQQVFDRMDRARTRQNVIILDACRDNPFAASFKVSSPGLAQSTAPSGTLIAYATAPGSVAADGFGRNGMYTKHLLQHIGTPDMPVESLFKRVRTGVEKETANRQTPWDSSSLKGDFHFNPGNRGGESAAAAPAAPAVAAGPSVDVQLQIEREFWVSVRDSERAEELQAYLDNFPNGKFVVIARLRLQNLGMRPAAPPREAPARSSWLRPADGEPRWLRVALPASPGAAAPTIEELVRSPQFAEIQLSPDGRQIAALMPVRGRQNLVVLDLANRKARAVSSLDNNDIVWFRWLSNRRFLVQTGTMLDRHCHCNAGSLYGIDADGSDLRRVSDGADVRDNARAVFRMLSFVRSLPGESDDFIAQEVSGGSDGAASAGGLYRVNSRTGRKVPLLQGKPDSGESEQWVVDNNGVPRAFAARRRGSTAIWYRDGADAPWRKLDEFGVGKPSWEPLAIAEDGRSLYASSWKDRDRAAIVLLEPKPGAEGRFIASHPYVDVKSLVYDAGVPVGVTYNADRPGVAWFDEELERIQGAVDTALPGATNELTWSRDRSRVLVKSSSDLTPGAYYLFYRDTGRIEWLVDRTPWIKAERMSPVKPVRYKARDGLDIPSYLTLPRAAKSGTRHPLVVMVHNWPWTEGAYWHFDATVQLLASRGFAVLQPNFRGISRYGWKHYSASFRQWGRAMQDDLADGVAWAVAQGYADPDRVCVMGEGYGGYAALMGLVSAPDVFRCAVSEVGITDLVQFMGSPWSPVTSSDFMRYDATELIGDPSRDRRALTEVSPASQVDRIRGSTLLIYRADSFLVPIEQGQAMRTALERGGKKVTWMTLANEGHGLPSTSNLRASYEALEKFLGENIAR